MKDCLINAYTWANKKKFDATHKSSGDKCALIINGSKKFVLDKTRLNHTLHQVAKEELESRGYQVLETIVDKGYEPKEEVHKFVSSELIIYQMPAWWMGEPWIVKKYIDEVFSAEPGVLCKNDGRTRSDPSKKYGSGGLCQGKKVLFSVTWNAPLEAFTEPNQFFEGVGIEGVYLHLKKAHEFCGMECLPIFSCHDVVKNPQVEQYIANYRAHLARVLD